MTEDEWADSHGAVPADWISMPLYIADQARHGRDVGDPEALKERWLYMAEEGLINLQIRNGIWFYLMSSSGWETNEMNQRLRKIVEEHNDS